MIITRVLKKIGLTMVYPVARVLLAPLDQLSGQRTGFFEGIKNIWRSEAPKNKKD